MNSQRMTDSGDDSNAVTVHISKHSQVPERREIEKERERGRKREGLKNVQEDFIFLSR